MVAPGIIMLYDALLTLLRCIDDHELGEFNVVEAGSLAAHPRHQCFGPVYRMIVVVAARFARLARATSEHSRCNSPEQSH
jgi:hypothetical protein